MSNLPENFPGRTPNEVAQINGALMAVLLNTAGPASANLLSEFVKRRLIDKNITGINNENILIFLADLVDRGFALECYIPDDGILEYVGTFALQQYIRNYQPA